MPSNRRCVFGCVTTGVAIHNFPNPKKFPERFQAWVNLAGERVKSMINEEIYQKLKVCDRHFTENFKNRNSRLNVLAIPTLNLPKTLMPVNVNLEQSLDPHTNLPSTSLNLELESETLKPVNVEQSVDPEHSVDPPTDLHLKTMNLSALCSMSFSGNQEKSADPVQSVDSRTDLPSTTTNLSALAVIKNDHDYCMRSPLPSCSTEPGPSLQASCLLKPPTSDHQSTRLEGFHRERAKYSSKETYYAAGTKKNKPVLKPNQDRNLQRQIRNFKREVNRLKKRGRNFKTRLANATKMSSRKSLEIVTNKMTLPAKIFTSLQFRETHKKPKGRRFTNEEKILSLSLYKRSPKCYALLSKCFALPSSKSLRNLLSKIKLTPGINKLIFEKLKTSVEDMNEEDRICTLIFDEMSVTPQLHYNAATDELKGLTSNNTNQIADHALAFMVRGVRKNFKQPVAYYFTQCLNRIDLKKIIKEVTLHVQATGLRIIATVCDQSAVNVGAIDGLIAEAKATYFRKGLAWKNDLIIVGNKKIIPLYDVPHLIKGIRNNLITKDLKYVDFNDNKKEKYIKWKYYQQLYEADKTYGELKILHKITEEHINPQKINKMRVKSATQLFSHSVAVAAKHLVDGGRLDPECLDLTPFSLMMDKLFDSLNCNTFHPTNGKIYRAGVRKNSPHHKLWEEGIVFLKNIKFIEAKKVGPKIRLIEKTVPSLKNFVKTIEGMQAIWKMLNARYTFDVLLCRNLNQDPIENFFGSIRSLGIRNVSPNTVGFEGAFKALLLNNFCSSQSVRGNCEDDGTMFIQTLDFFLNFDKNEEVKEDAEEIVLNNEILFPNTEINDDTEGIHSKTYVCGWVLRKCLKKIIKTCKTCKLHLIASEDSALHSLIKAKEYINKKWLCYPSEGLIKCFNEIQNNVTNSLKTNVNQNVKANIKLVNEILVSFDVFDCSKHKAELKSYFEDVSINVLVNSWCRSVNRILCGKLVYDGDDHFKMTAQCYYNKHKHNKNKK